MKSWLLAFLFTCALSPVFASIHLHVGTDEYLEQPGPQFNARGFKEFHNWNEEQINQFREKAVRYFTKRFGASFENSFPGPDGIFVFADGLGMASVTFESNYTVLSSNSDKIPTEVNGIPTRIRVAEFVLFYSPKAQSEGRVYGGTYASAQTEPQLIHAEDSVSFGIYQILLGDGQVFNIAMQSDVPSTAGNDKWVEVKLNLQSKEFGQGTGSFKALMDFTPNSENKYRAAVYGEWLFENE